MKACKIPPDGWYCTRRPGHKGPCAALPRHNTMQRIELFLRDTFEGVVDYVFTCIFDDYPAIFFTCFVTVVCLLVAVNFYLKYAK